MKTLTADEIRKRIGATTEKLVELIAAGLPSDGPPEARTFDPEAVDVWLITNQLAEEEQPEIIARTRSECAELLGLGIDGSRTISKWSSLAGFPGRAGTPGKRNAYYPIRAIIEWRRRNVGVPGRPGLLAINDDPEIWQLDIVRRKLLVDVQTQTLQEQLGRLADVESIARFNRRAVAAAVQILAPLADDVVLALPKELTPPMCEEVRATVTKLLENARLALEEIVAGDQDETEETEP